jgi:hypothetical protein
VEEGKDGELITRQYATTNDRRSGKEEVKQFLG